MQPKHTFISTMTEASSAAFIPQMRTKIFQNIIPWEQQSKYLQKLVLKRDTSLQFLQPTDHRTPTHAIQYKCLKDMSPQSQLPSCTTLLIPPPQNQYYNYLLGSTMIQKSNSQSAERHIEASSRLTLKNNGVSLLEINLDTLLKLIS